MIAWSDLFMSRYYFTVPKYHYELFGHNTAVKDIEIKEAIFGYNAIELWARSSVEERKDANKYISIVKVVDLINPATEHIQAGRWASLVTSIQQIGITTPLLLIEREEDGKIKFWILEGHHRAAAAEKLGISEVPAIIIREDQEYTEKMLSRNA